MVENKKTIEIGDVVTVKSFAEKADLPVTAVISQLMKSGVLANINETIDFDTASIIGDDLGIIVAKEGITKKTFEKSPAEVTSRNLVLRPPVVTIMGHVDHGKTTLLDQIRKAHVASGESGGITQHISAYQVQLTETKNKEIKNKTITFIDTPGHAAFSAMRLHGTAITDIVVLIVAANDGIMPQTKEVIEQAKESNVPIIVAINKVDLPDSDPMKVKQQLSELELVPEEWGGKTIMVEISAKLGTGVDNLLEMILLQAELMELKASVEDKAVGVVIESHMEKGAGAMASVLIENGTLNQGEPISIGSVYGKVRILEDFFGRAIKSAGPSTPVRIAGLKSLPDFGDKLIAFDNEKEAKENAAKSKENKPQVNIATAKRIGGSEETPNDYYELRLIIRSDVVGSLEALKKSLAEVRGEDYGIKLISEGVGAVSESDVTLAKATHSVIMSFRVGALGAAKRIAEKEGIKISTFQVIYELIDNAKLELADLLPLQIIEEELGTGKILGIFRDDKKGFVAGGNVLSGRISMGDEIKFLQNKHEKYKAKILSLRREKSEAKEVESGSECGFGLPAGANVAVGDEFVAFNTVHKKREIV